MSNIESYFGLHWSNIIDDFFKLVEKLCNTYEYSSFCNVMNGELTQYVRTPVAEMDIIIKYGTLKIIWDKTHILSQDNILLEKQTKEFTDQLIQLSEETEKKCNTICYNCGKSPAFTKEDQRGGFSTLCNVCRCENDLYKINIQ
jgi:hypothetical protein